MDITNMPKKKDIITLMAIPSALARLGSFSRGDSPCPLASASMVSSGQSTHELTPKGFIAALKASVLVTGSEAQYPGLTPCSTPRLHSRPSVPDTALCPSWSPLWPHGRQLRFHPPGENFPSSQARQSDCPLRCWVVPAAQGRQLAAPGEEKRPAGQVMHADAFSVAEYVPPSQLTHAPVPSAPLVHAWPGEQNGRPRGSLEPAKSILLVRTMPSKIWPRAMFTKAADVVFACELRLLSSYSMLRG
eukprot:7389399-Prymnesium_polylepis.1